MAQPQALDGDLLTVRAAQICVALVVLVGLLDVFFFYLELLPSEIIRRSFDISREESMGTWVSTMLALFTGMVALVLAAHSKQTSEARLAIGWLIVALCFIYISFDDAAKFHERMGTAFRVKGEMLTDTKLDSWFPSWGWQLYVMPLFAAMGVFLVWFLSSVVSAQARLWVFCGIVLMGSAVGIDFIEGVLDRRTEDINHFMRLTEELMEMFGTTAFLYAFMRTASEKLVIFVTTSSEGA